MQNIIQKLIHMDIRATLSALMKRFPLPVILAIIVSLLWFYVVNIDDNQDWTYRTIITGIVVFFLSTAVSLLHEQVKMTRVVSIATWMIPVVFGILFYWSIDGIYDGDIEPVTYTILSLVGFFSSLFVAPFLPGLMKRKEENTIHFSNYFTQIAWVVLMSVVVGGVLMALGSIAIGSVLTLFDIEEWLQEDDLLGNWAVISLSLTAPLYALASLPYARDYETKDFVQNKFFSFIIRYIATPFIFVYFLILYAYSAKVLMNFSDWPKGIISWMVIGFSSFGYLIYILSRAYAGESRMVAVFRRFFPYMVAPQILMLGYAIYLRINQYDLTMNRYFVVIFGIWLTIVSLYYIISTKKSLSMIPASLVAAILIISIGPWSVYSFPVARQEARLIDNLRTANILQGDTIIPLAKNSDITKELSTSIYSSIEYICRFDDCDTIKSRFPAQYEQAIVDGKKEWEQYTHEGKEPYTEPSKYQIVAAVTQYIKVQQYWGMDDVAPKYLQFNTKGGGVYPLDITGYDQIVQLYAASDTYGAKIDPYITVDPDTREVRYHELRKSDTVFTLPLRSDLDMDATRNVLSQSELTFSLTGKTIDIRLIFDTYATTNPMYQSGADIGIYYNISGIALIRDKK